MFELIYKSLGSFTALMIIALLAYLLIRFAFAKMQTRQQARSGLLFAIILSLMAGFAAQSLWFEADRALKVSKLEPYGTLERLILSTREFDLLVAGHIATGQADELVAHFGRSRAAWMPALGLRLADGHSVQIDAGYKPVNWKKGERIFEKALRNGEQVIVWGSSYLSLGELDQETAAISPRLIYAGDFHSFKTNYQKNLGRLSPVMIGLSWLFLALSPLPFVLGLKRYFKVIRAMAKDTA